MSSSSRTRVEDTYEAQNDQRLDDLHAKIRSIRGVTTDIYNDVERQHLTLDETGNSFSSFQSSLENSARQAARAFGLNGTGVRTWRLIGLCIGALVGLWLLYRVVSWWRG